MIIRKITIGILAIGLLACNPTKDEKKTEDSLPDIVVVGALKNVMWKGELNSNIIIDTISNKKGLYGLGPESYLMGELLVNNGKSYVSKVTSESTMVVYKTFETSAPFFVYTNVNEWEETKIPPSVKTIPDLEKFIEREIIEYKKPFVFKMAGKVLKAIIHIQNLPEGTQVSSPDEAHQGQVNYELENEVVEIIGFFSTNHKGVFTHHDSFLHMHLITKDELKMGHLDKLEIDNMKLYLPKN